MICKMNRSFENIFEKYNIDCGIPKKRYRSPKSGSFHFHKKKLPILSGTPANYSISDTVQNTRKCLNYNFSCYLNTQMEAKYYNPTRYKRLDVTKVENITTFDKYSLSETLPSKENGIHSKSEYISKGSSNERECLSPADKTAKSINIQPNTRLDSKGKVFTFKNNLPNSLNVQKSNNEEFGINRHNITTSNKENINYASDETAPTFKSETLNKPNYSLTTTNHLFENSFPKSSEIESFNSAETQPVQNSCTELDLLIDLIEHEEKNKNKQNEKLCKGDDILLYTKHPLKGGYQEMFERALKHEKVKSNFLKYDKKIGLRSGKLLTVIKIESFYGLSLATVECEDFNKNFLVVVPPDMAPRLKSGTQIEAFFDDKIVPYKLLLNGEYLEVYLEPFKLLVV